MMALVMRMSLKSMHARTHGWHVLIFACIYNLDAQAQDDIKFNLPDVQVSYLFLHCMSVEA